MLTENGWWIPAERWSKSRNHCCVLKILVLSCFFLMTSCVKKRKEKHQEANGSVLGGMHLKYNDCLSLLLNIFFSFAISHFVWLWRGPCLGGFSRRRSPLVLTFSVATHECPSYFSLIGLPVCPVAQIGARLPDTYCGECTIPTVLLPPSKAVFDYTKHHCGIVLYSSVLEIRQKSF